MVPMWLLWVMQTAWLLSMIVVCGDGSTIGEEEGETARFEVSSRKHNDNRLMVHFDLECIKSLDLETKDASLRQESRLNAIIKDHYPCLSHTMYQSQGSRKRKHFQLESKNVGISFVDIDKSNNCLLSDDGDCLDAFKSIDNCISQVSYEPKYNLFSTFGSEFTKYTSSDDYNCETVNTSYLFTRYGLDMSDSSSFDSQYTYVDISRDNGVDIYVVDSGVRSTHEEFEANQVIHVIGDGPAYYESEDWYSSHGTYMADVASGREYGHAKNVTIYDYRVCEFGDSPQAAWDVDCYASDIMNALSEINDNLSNTGRRGVVNVALGSYEEYVTVFSYYFEYYFGLIRENGGIVVVAAGNYDDDACNYSPAFASNAITVGAIDYQYKKTSWSNYGDCVDTWAAGSAVYCALATNDTGYNYQSGTSLASGAVTGTIANLLWVDPTLTLYEMKSILAANTVTITSNECDSEYSCTQFLYDCGTLPASYYGSSTLPTTTSEDDKSYEAYAGVYDYDGCNYMGVATIDASLSDSSESDDYWVKELTYIATDKCIAEQDGSSGESYSYSIECKSSNTAQLVVYLNNDCSGDGTVMKEIVSGYMTGDSWYLVDCDQSDDINNEIVDSFDDSDCDVIYRVYTEFDDNDTCSYNNDSQATFYDVAFVNGACNLFENGSLTYSYEYWCDDSNIYVSYYSGDSCDYDKYYGDYYLATSGCYSQYKFEILECGSVDLWEEFYNSQLAIDDGTWFLIWFSVVVAGACAFIGTLVLIISLDVYWQCEKFHCCYVPFISPHKTLSQKKIVSINDNIKHFFRILTCLILLVYSVTMILIFLAQFITNICIAEYEATSWANESTSLYKTLIASYDMYEYAFYLWFYSKTPLYILFISRLWYGFRHTKYEYPIWVFIYFGVLLTTQMIILSVWLFDADDTVYYSFIDLFFIVYSGLDMLIIGSCLFLFVRRLTSLAVSQTVEKALRTGEISVVPSSEYKTQSSQGSTRGSTGGSVQSNIVAANEDDDQDTAGRGSVASPVSQVKDTDTVVLDKKQLKLVFEITRYVLLTTIAMMSTFIMGFFLTYLNWKLADESCDFDCENNLYAVFAVLQSLDCFINVVAIHLNSGFQKKNYGTLCAHPHKFIMKQFASHTKRRAVEKVNNKLNKEIEMNNRQATNDEDHYDDDDYHYEDESHTNNNNDNNDDHDDAPAPPPSGITNASSNSSNDNGGMNGGNDGTTKVDSPVADSNKSNGSSNDNENDTNKDNTSFTSTRAAAAKQKNKPPTLAEQHDWDFD